jgi:hypothetical protein
MLRFLCDHIADPDPVFTSMRVHIQKAVLRIRIPDSLIPHPDPSFRLNTNPDPDPGF